ncbi:MAG: M48 family metalloprotease [Terracidiphilus sp.]
MKRLVALAGVLLVAGGALYLAQHRKHADEVSATALVDAAADWQRDVTRAPLRLTRLPDEQESRIGDELAQQYLSALPAPTAQRAEVESYINHVGGRVAAHAKRKLDYRFHLIPDANLIKAFALPGGHVFVGQGLLNQMDSEDELAFVLGHEIEHIDHYHAVERVQIAAQLRNFDLGAVADLAQIPISLWQAGYSKDEEFEADREGLRLAAAAGYSPQGAVNLLKRFSELDREYVIHAETPADELSQMAIEGLEGYFRTHPLPNERLAQANEVIADDGLDVSRPLTPLRINSKIASEVQ